MGWGCVSLGFLAMSLTSLVMCARWSLKYRIVLMWTPSILYDLFGGRYLMWVPSRNFMECIWACSISRIFCVRGLPRAQSAPVASHLVVSSCRPVYWLKRCSFFSWISKFWIEPAVILMSSAYPWSSKVMMEAVGLCDWNYGMYPLLPTAIHRSRGSMKMVKRKGDRVSPCRVPLSIWMGSVFPCIVTPPI